MGLPNEVNSALIGAAAAAGGYEIEQSLRFDGSSRLTRTHSCNQTRTFSFWNKYAFDNVNRYLYFHGDGSFYLGTRSGGDPSFNSWQTLNQGSSFTQIYRADVKFRDPSAWYHFVFKCTSSDVILYINGEQWGNTGGANIALSSKLFEIGSRGNAEFFAGYQAEWHFVDGQALDPTDFGEYDNNGVWRPIAYTGSYGTNGFYLTFDPSATNGIGHDHSGNGNNFTPSGFTTSGTGTDVMSDTPTNNYSLINRAGSPSSLTLSEGNLKGAANSSGGYQRALGSVSFGMDAKVMAESTLTVGAFKTYAFGLQSVGRINSNGYLADDIYQGVGIDGLGRIWKNGSIVHTGTAPTNGAVMTITFDGPAAEAEFFVNGVSQYTVTGVPDDEYIFNSYVADTCSVVVNNGQRPFTHSQTGFSEVSTANLPAVDIKDPSDHFQTVLGPGTGGVQIKTVVSADGTVDKVYGFNDTNNNNNSNHPAYQWARGLTINGYSDWYIMAGYEADIVYYNLKPTTSNNDNTNVTAWGLSGLNPHAIPARTQYQTTVPGQTSVAAFQSGGAEALPATTHWITFDNISATGYAKNFDTGEVQRVGKTTKYDARAIRRVAYTGSEPAIGAEYEGGFFAGLIDAKSTPDGTATHAIIVSPKLYGQHSAILSMAQTIFPNGLWWVKDRQNANQHQLVDSVRGSNLAIFSPSENTETTYSAPSGNSVAWCWNLVTGRSNGFDIVTYTGNGTAGRTVSHNLGYVPEWILIGTRTRGGAAHRVYHVTQGATKVASLNTSDSFGTDNSIFNSTEPTSTNFTLGSGSMNTNTEDYVAYLWRSVPGYSAFGTYTGNGSTDGAFVATSFAPAMIIIKKSSASANWVIMDQERYAYNPRTQVLYPSATSPEVSLSGTADIDFLSNGFKIRRSWDNINASGGTYVYMAFASSPFGGSNVSPATAR